VSRSFEMPEAQWATVGTVGPPGRRTFYLQARQDDQLVTLKLEKQQVAAIAQFLGEILSDLPTPDGLPNNASMNLTEPVLAEWAVGALQLAYDSGSDRIVLLAEEVSDDAGDADDPDDVVGLADEPSGIEALLGQGSESDPSDRGVGRIGLTRVQAAAIVARSWELVQSGRPTCALCGHPIDPEGHSCPRTNGHRPPAP
jgi:uncharacterized repeat protein (TIGR03847 family)